MNRMVGKILSGYGQEIQVEQEGAVAICHGFFQPVHETSLQHLELDMAEFGRIPGGKYQIMVPPDVMLDVGTRIGVGNGWYVVRATERIYGGKTALYMWGLLVKEGRDDGDIS